MRHAFISDIHANAVALDAVIAHLETQSIDVILCLGDLVGYGPFPGEVLGRLRELTPYHVLGNHDAAVCGLMDPSSFNAEARRIAEWTEKQLSDAEKSFLYNLPLFIEGESFRATHAEFSEPDAFWYLEDEETAREAWALFNEPLMLIGHTHDPMVHALDPEGQYHCFDPSDFQVESDWRYIVNVGSVGLPRDGDPRACYVVYDEEAATVNFHRVEFDVPLHVLHVQNIFGPNPQAMILLETYELVKAGRMSETQSIRLGDWVPDDSHRGIRVRRTDAGVMRISNRGRAIASSNVHSVTTSEVAVAKSSRRWIPITVGLCSVLILALIGALIARPGTSEEPSPGSPDAVIQHSALSLSSPAAATEPASIKPKIEIVAKRSAGTVLSMPPKVRDAPSDSPHSWSPAPPMIQGQCAFYDFEDGIEEGLRVEGVTPTIRDYVGMKILHVSGGTKLSLQDLPSTNTSTVFTVGFWLRFPEAPNRPAEQAIMGKGLDSWRLVSTRMGSGLRLSMNQASKLRSVALPTAVDLNDGSWHHIALVRGESVLRIFVDGKKAADLSTTVALQTNSQPVVLGASGADAPSSDIVMDIDRLTISPEALAISKVAEWYKLEQAFYRQ